MEDRGYAEVFDEGPGEYSRAVNVTRPTADDAEREELRRFIASLQNVANLALFRQELATALNAYQGSMAPTFLIGLPSIEQAPFGRMLTLILQPDI